MEDCGVIHWEKEDRGGEKSAEVRIEKGALEVLETHHDGVSASNDVQVGQEGHLHKPENVSPRAVVPNYLVCFGMI